jgi:hypothetical protein
VTSKKGYSLLIAMICLLCLAIAVSAWLGNLNHRKHTAAIAILKESVYLRAAAQASTQLKMLQYLEANESTSAQQLSESLLQSAALTLAEYSPPADVTEASETIVAVRQKVAEYRSR